MSETYTVGLDSWMPLSSLVDIGQVFTPKEAHTLDFIDLQLKPALLFLPEPIRVYACDITGQPVGPELSFSLSYTFQKGTILLSQRVRFRMKSTFLQQDQRYIITWHFPIPVPYWIFWGYDSADQAYMPRGWRMTRGITDPTWTPRYDQCHIFCEFGDPPLPTPEPPPPILPFAIPAYTPRPCLDPFQITLATTVPCHLTCYWTSKKPLKHSSTRTLRGLDIPWGTYFCFVAWNLVEQEEPGDTLYHTFIFPSWTLCQTRWFTFRGEVNDIPSPSVGPIFRYHRTARHTVILRPNGSGDLNQLLGDWGANPPNHYLNVDEAVSDENTTANYDSALTGTKTETYKVDTAPTGIKAICDVTVYQRTRKFTGSAAYGRVVLRINGTNYYGAEYNASNRWGGHSKSWTTNPDTGLPWTEADLNSMQIGFQRRNVNPTPFAHCYITQAYATVTYI
ncbi:hypothetical protein ES703_22442 [subsurface metagenome]